jgi:GT2 family glycosyltransferase
MKKITLSIIIVSFNTEKLTVRCIQSIVKHKPSFAYEIVVVDNGSSDGSVEGIKKLKLANLTLITSQTNLGFSKANNKGIKAAQGEYILLLNSDTEIIDTSLEELVAFAREHQDAGVVAPQLLNKDKTVQASIFRLPTIWRAVSQYIFKNKGILSKYSLSFTQVVESVVGAAFLITPKALKKVGMLDEKYFMYFEDLDYCKKVNEAGLFVYYFPDTHVIHIHGASGTPGINNLLVESSKKYFGIVRYYIYTFVLWLGQKYGTN